MAIHTKRKRKRYRSREILKQTFLDLNHLINLNLDNLNTLAAKEQIF